MKDTHFLKINGIVVTLVSVLCLSSIAATQLLSANNYAAFAAMNCDFVDNGETIEQECSGGQGSPGFATEDPNAVGGTGGHFTCTTDLSSFENTCTSTFGTGGRSEDFTGGMGSRATHTSDQSTDTITANGGGGGQIGDTTGGTGGRNTCTADLSTGGDYVCSGVGGSGTKPR